MSDTELHPRLSPAEARQIDQACDRFEAAWKAGQRPRPPEYLAPAGEPARSALLRQLLILDWDYRRRAGENPCPSDYHALFPGDSALIEAVRGELTEPSAAVDAPDQLDSDEALYQAATRPPAPLQEGPGTRIGPYKLLQQIGEGGMGTVFMAEQRQPVHRKVALKIIKPGMDSKQVIARFEAERQALAMMDHQNIARVLDAGTTGSEPEASARDTAATSSFGRPYFVMELVHGVPITQFCDEHKLTPRQRLELFVPVCQAIQHAHQKGIIHRDIKPSNVLVTMYDDKPVPKVIDFGVAKAVEQRLTDKTMFTQFGAFVGTFDYMSPEQAEMNAFGVDTRSDIYSLGVLLYELLTWTTPLEQKRLRQAALPEMVRLIKEEEAPRPSVRLSSTKDLPKIAAARNTEPARLSKLIRGDIDWIVMKCLEKDRTRRYESASGLARDIQRHLADEPVEACPPSASYRLGKFVRRNKTGLTIAGMALFFLVFVGGGVGWVMRDRAARQSALDLEMELALKEAERLEAQRKYSEAFQAAKRAQGLLAGGSSQRLQERVRKLQEDLEMAQRLEAVRLSVFETGNGAFDFATEAAEYAAAFRDFGIDAATLDPQEVAQRITTTTIRIELAWALDDWAFVCGMGRKEGAAYRKRLRAAARLADPDELRNYIRDAQESLDSRRLRELVNSEKSHALRWPTLQLLSVAIFEANEMAQVLALARRAQIQHPDDFWYNMVLADMLTINEPLQALRFCTAALALRPESPAIQNNLAWLLATCPDPGLRDPNQAIALAKKAPKHRFYWRVLGAANYRVGQWQAAVDALNKSMELRQGGDSRDWFFLAMSLWKLNQNSSARKWYYKAVDWMERNQPRADDLRRFRAEAAEQLGVK